MPAKKHHWLLKIFLIIVVCANFLGVRSAHADGETPTEPPAPTQIATEPPTEPPAESTPEPVEATPEPVEVTATPLAELLVEAPENTEVIVLDENGDSVPLASQEATDITEATDPMWCPEGVLPGGSGCTTNFASVTDLINDMLINTATYTQNGVIYFTANPGSGILDLSPTTLTSDYDTLKNYNLTLQGGWDGTTGSPSLSGQTNFGTNPITVGSSANPWVGNISLINIRFSGVSSGDNAITVYTDTGDITLNNVDVQSQSGGGNAAMLDTNSGHILVENGSTFQSAIVVNRGNGFRANSDTGSITISGASGANITFNNFRAPGAPFYNGATLSAPTVSLSYVTASGNDGNGFFISGASMVTLNNVTSGPDVDTQGNGRSGVLINGTGSTIAQVIGGTFADNGRYGIEISGGSLFVYGSPTCPTAGATANSLGCYNVTPSIDSTGPVITPNVSGTAGSNGWYTSDVSVSWSVTDAESGILSSTGCTATDLTSDTNGTTLFCSATNHAGLSNPASVTIKIDKAAPALSLPSDITVQASGPTVVNYSASATDNFDPSASATCSPSSGSTFALGTTTVNCLTGDAAGNTASGSFQVTVADTTVIVTPTPPTPPSTGSTSGTSTSDSSNSQPNASPPIIPVTGGKVIDLDCNSALQAFGIKLSFMNLCDYQTTLDSIGLSDLPGALPDGYSFVMGLNLSILSENQAIEELPNGTSIQLDFPMSGGSKDEFAVLYWNDGEWVEVPQQVSDDQGFYQVLTTDNTGIFVLVKK
ncbi:MAG: HYR domain-containing protein [Chloroflexi bacterium]|nr:MAG: HYR domain-containing protein [Chloroflexota bacterium]